MFARLRRAPWRTGAAAASALAAHRCYARCDALPRGAPTKWEELQAAADDAPKRRTYVTGVSMKEISEGTGDRAALGMWVAAHYTVKLVGDGSVLESTHTSGYGDRDYGQPHQFTLGQLTDEWTLRALHACTLDMRVGGRRRVRTSLSDPDFGYRELPSVRDADYRERWLLPDWLMDVEVTLVSVRPEPPSLWERIVAWLSAATGRVS